MKTGLLKGLLEFLRMTSSSSPVRIFASVLAISITAVIATLLMPALIAARHGVFYPEGLRAQLENNMASELVELRTYEQRVDKIKRQLADLDQHIFNSTEDEQPEHRAHLLDLRIKLNDFVQAYKPPVSLIALYLNPQMLLWPGIYAALGVLILVCPPHQWQWSRRKLRSIAGLAIFIYLFYEWPLWVRNFVLGKHGRVVYAYPNYNIDPASFWYQELTIFGFAALVATLWIQWSDATVRCSRDLDGERCAETSYTVFSAKAADRLAEYYAKWTYTSVILALGFLFFTNFFWSLVAKYHDQRYLLSAVLAHSIWGISWISISLPLWNIWVDWGKRRSKEIERSVRITEEQRLALKHEDKLPISVGKDEQSRGEQIVKLLGDANPVKALNFGLANITAAISFVLPLLQFLTTK